MPYVPGKVSMLHNVGVSAIMLLLPGMKFHEEVVLKPGQCVNLDSLLFRDVAYLNRVLLPFESSEAIKIMPAGEMPAFKQASPAVGDFDAQLSKLLNEESRRTPNPRPKTRARKSRSSEVGND